MSALRLTALVLMASGAAGLRLEANTEVNCECPVYSSFEESIADTPLIFAGIPVYQCQDLKTSTVRFAVSAVYRGDCRQETTITTPFHSGTSNLLCGFQFVLGQEYLVYVRQSQSTDSCTRTRRLSHASDDLAHLGTSRPPAAERTPAPPPAPRP